MADTSVLPLSVRLRPRLLVDDLPGAVRAGCAATVVASVGLAGYAVHGTRLEPDQQASLVVLVLVALAGCVGIRLLVRRRGGGPGLMAAWSVGDVALITAGAAVTGGWASPLVWLLVLPVVFFTVLLDTTTAALLIAVTAAAPFIAGWTAGTPVDADVAIVLEAVIAAAGLISSYLAQLLAEQARQAESASRSAERRAQLLDVTTHATRSLIETDGDAVLDNLLRATALLGFGGVLLHEADSDGLVCTRQVGLSPDWLGSRAAEAGPLTRAAGRAETVVANIDGATAGTGGLHADGFRSVCAVPVVVSGRLDSVLTAVSRRQQQLTGHERAAVESLAAHAAVALRNARTLEAEAAARQREERLHELQHDFTSTAAHELRTPLTVVNGTSELLATHWDDLADTDRRDLVERMRAHSKELVRLVERLHGLDQLRRGDVAARREPVVAKDLLSTVTATFDRRRNVHLITSRSEPGLQFMGDRRLLEKVLEELTENAIRHTPAGTHVHLAAMSAEGGTVEFAVADDGPGVEQDDATVLTEAFQRPGAVNTRGSRGIGIGLAVVRHILQLHDASIEIDLRPPGACFKFRLSNAEGPTGSSQDVRLDDLVLRVREETATEARLN